MIVPSILSAAALLIHPVASAAVAQAATRTRAMTVAAAEPTGRRRWVVWQDGAAPNRAAHLSMWSGGRLSRAVDWPDGYEPTLRVVSEWRHGGIAVAMVTLQYGAAAVEVSVFGIGRDGRPIRLVTRTAVASGWLIGADGEPFLVTYAETGTGLVPTCLAWTPATAKLAARACPAG